MCGCIEKGGNIMSYTVKARTATYIGHEAENGVVEFLGIPYAKPPRRWKRAESLEPSDEVFLADKDCPAAWQPCYDVEWDEAPPMSEDCLYLNLWTKNLEEKKKAVMVWIHGGSYISGSARKGCFGGIYWGENLVRNNPDIIYININYRLNAFASLDFSKFDKTGEFADSTNLQTYDQIEALKWVHENIEAFGGDPENVTVFGQSAGGMSVAALLCIKEANKYFKNVICESTALSEAYIKTKSAAAKMAETFYEALDAKSMEDMLSRSPEEIRDAGIKHMMHYGFDSRYGAYSPCWGYGIFPENPIEALKKGAADGKNLMIGTVSGEFDTVGSTMDTDALKKTAISVCQGKLTDEMCDRYFKNDLKRDEHETWQDLWNDMLLREGSVSVGEAHATSGGKVYMYYIQYMDKNAKLRPQHCFEIPYINDKTDAASYMDKNSGEPVQGQNPSPLLQKRIQSCWTNFAREGNPNNDSLTVKWPVYSSANRYTMVIDKEWYIEKGVRNEDMEICIEIRNLLKSEKND